MKRNTLLALVALGSLIVSCKKENNNTSNGSNVSYQLVAADRSSTLGAVNTESSTLQTAAAINWTSGFANVTELKFEAKNKENDISYRSGTDRHIDLFNPIASAGTILIPSGTYDRVKFKLELAPTNNEPALELEGNYNGTPVILRVSQPIEIKGAQQNVTVTDNNGYTAITDLNLSTLLNNVSANSLNNATRTNGQIVISSSSNQNLYNRLVGNLRDHENECRWKRN